RARRTVSSRGRSQYLTSERVCSVRGGSIGKIVSRLGTSTSGYSIFVRATPIAEFAYGVSAGGRCCRQPHKATCSTKSTVNSLRNSMDADARDNRMKQRRSGSAWRKEYGPCHATQLCIE